MERIPWPTTHTGLTAADIPRGYNAFPTVFDDRRGYEPCVVGHYTDDAGRIVIMVAVSPGAVIEATMVSAGQAPEEAARATLEAFRALGSPGSNPAGGAPAGGPGSDRPTEDHRED